MVVAVAGEAQEDAAVLRVLFHHLEPQHFRVELLGALNVAHLDETVANPFQLDRHGVLLELPQCGNHLLAEEPARSAQYVQAG